MALINNLHIFDKNGVRIGSSESSRIELTFDEVSSGLFSCQQINILEKVINRLNNKSVVTFNEPREIDSTIKIKFKNKNFKNFFVFKTVYDSTLKNNIVKSISNNTNLDLHLEGTLDNLDFSTNYERDYLQNNETLQSGQIKNNITKITEDFIINLNTIEYVENINDIDRNSAFLDSNGIKNYHIYGKNRNSLSFDIGFTSDVDGEFSETIELYLIENEEETLLAEISLFATCVEEDERLTNILNVFGQSLEIDDSLVFRDTDVNEDLEDNIVLNEKKKELILEYSNIIPFIGSYKGLINALKFYGYDDLKIKEWWLNLTNDSYSLFEIDKDTYKTITNGQNVFGQNNQLKRTGKFSLFYNLFTLGEVDRYGIPEVIPAFPYSNDEVLIKLYGLKSVLKNKYLPLSTRIVDITGEGIVFSRASTETWNTINSIQEINKYDLDINIEVENTFNLIDQIQKTEKTIETKKLSEILNDTLRSKATLKPVDLMQKYDYKDIDKYKSYSEIKIKDKTFNRKIKDFTDYIQDIENIPFYILETFPIYEVEYTFYTKDNKGKTIILRGKPSDFKEFTIKTDVAGSYSAVVKMYDIYGNTNVKRISNLFLVELPEPYFGVHYKNSIQYKRIIDAQKIKVKDAHINAVDQTLNNLKIKDFEKSTLESLNIHNYFKEDVYEGCYYSKIKEVDRENKHVIFDKKSIQNINDLYSQSVLNFRRVDEKEIKPVAINNIDYVNNKITITGKKAPEAGDTIELFEYFEIQSNVEILEDNWIQIDAPLKIRDDFYLYLYNTENEDVAYLEVKQYVVDEFQGYSKFKVEDPDGLLYYSEYNTFFIIKDKISIDVISTSVTGNDTLIEVKSTVDIGLEYLSMKLDTGLSIYCWWNVFTGNIGIPILEIIDSGEEIKVKLEDNENEIFLVNSKFKAVFNNYDIKNIDNVAKQTFKIKDLETVKLIDINNKTLDCFENTSSVKAGFLIENWNSNAKIKINDSDWFQFSSVCADDIDIAIEELSSTNIIEFNKYNYFKIGNNIKAVCKTYGFETLDIIEFTGGVNIYPKLNPRYACNYQIPPVIKQEINYTENTTNNRMLWNNLIRDWVYSDETAFIEKTKMSKHEYVEGDDVNNFRIQLGPSMNSGFRLININSSFDPIFIGKHTQCFFFADCSKSIIGKKKYKWTISKDNEILVEIQNKFLSYVFHETGSYDITIEITDWNGNASKNTKFNFINII